MTGQNIPRDEFVKICQSAGYCAKQLAEEYAGERDSFTVDDYIAVFRMEQSRNFGRKSGEHDIAGGGKSTTSGGRNGSDNR